MKRIKRASIILIAMGLIVTLTMVIPASAQTGEGSVKVLDSEFVLCTMESTGQIEEIQVFDWLSFDGDGTVTVREEAAYDDVGGYQGVKGFTTPSVEDGYIVWPEINVDGPANVIAATVLSESDVEEARTRIPLDVRFKYRFDGVPVTDLETITGKSGRFELELTLTNTSAEEMEIEYEDPETGEMVAEEVDVYLPLVVLPYDWYFDNSIFYNLECDETGIVVNMPDFYNVGWSIPLFPPATEESHTIWVKADVKNFQMPPLTLSVNFVFPETNQSDPLELLGPAALQIYDGIKQVSDGIGAPDTADTLLYGITQVDDGLTQLAAGLPEAKTNLDNQLIPGVTQAAAAIGSPGTPDTLLYGNTLVTGGLQDISFNIGSETTDATLLFAANAVVGGLQQISANLGSPTSPGTLINGVYQVIMGLDNPSGVPQPGILQGLQQISSNIGSTSTPGTLLEGAQLLANNTNPASGPLYIAVETVYDGLNTGGNLTTAINNLYTTYLIPAGDPDRTNIDTIYIPTYVGSLSPTVGALAGIAQIYNDVTKVDPTFTDPGFIQALQALKAGADDMINGVNQMLAGLNLVYGGLIQFQNGIGSATTPDTLLYAASAIEGGLAQVKAGIGDAAVPDTLLYGTASIQNGLYQLQAGLSTGNINDPGIKEGLVLISAGIGDAVEGLGSPGTPDTLLYGTDQLEGGLVQAGDGASQLEEGVAFLIETLNMSEAELEAIKMRGEEFDHFLGRAEGEENEVRFVYQSNPTYNYVTGNTTSWIVAIVLSIIIALALVAGGIMLARRGQI